MQRTLVIVGAIVVLLAIGVGIYFLFFNHHASLSTGAPSSFPQAATESGSGTTAPPPPEALGVPVAGAGTEIAPHLVRVTDEPVSLGAVAVYTPGSGTIGTTTASSTVYVAPDVRVEYIDRQSGNVYAYQAHGRTLVRLSNKTLPGIQEAVWLSDGSLAYARYIDTTGGATHIATYALPATTTDGYFLTQDLAQVATHGTSTLATLFSTTDGSSASVSNPSGAGLKSLFQSPLSALRLAFFGTNYLATTKPTATSDGYTFLVDGKTGGFTRLLGPLLGLSTLPSPSGNYVLYNYLTNGKLSLALLNAKSRTATLLPLATLADKCAWSADETSIYCGVPTTLSGTLPDDWYQGAVTFNDRLWRIDLISRTASLVIDPSQAANVPMDMEGLTLDSRSDVVVFTNRRDGNLYVYDL